MITKMSNGLYRMGSIINTKFRLIAGFCCAFVVLASLHCQGCQGPEVDDGYGSLRHWDAAMTQQVSAANASLNLERHGVLIAEGAVPGWKAHFNGDLYPRSDEDACSACFLAIVRMVRDDYSKIKTNAGDRGFSLQGDYISDWGLFTVNLEEKTAEFLKIVVASPAKLERQIDKLSYLVAISEPDDPQAELAWRALASLQAIAAQADYPLPAAYIMEDPRFMPAAGRLFIVGTAVHAPQLLAAPNGEEGSESPLPAGHYQMAAFEVRITSQQGRPDLELLTFRKFGPEWNKDSGFFDFTASGQLAVRIKELYSRLGLRVPPLVAGDKVLMAYSRVGGAMQVFPMAAIDDLFALTAAQLQELARSGLSQTLLVPDALGDGYQSVGWNNQPMPLPAALGGGYLVMFHATESRSFNPDHPTLPVKMYVTYAALLNAEGKLVGVSRAPIQKPREAYENFGDVNHVLFNSGNAIVAQGGNYHLYLFNGGADSVVALASLNLKALVDYLKGLASVGGGLPYTISGQYSRDTFVP